VVSEPLTGGAGRPTPYEACADVLCGQSV